MWGWRGSAVRTLAAFVEAWTSVPSRHRALTTAALGDLTPGPALTHAYPEIHTYIHIHTNNNTSLKMWQMGFDMWITRSE